MPADERWIVINKAKEEDQCLHKEDPDGSFNPTGEIILMEPSWNPNGGGLDFLQHYRKCILEGLKNGFPKEKSLDMIQALQQKPNEDPSEFLEMIYQAYRKHTDADPQGPENV